MTDSAPQSRGSTPVAASLRRTVEEVHAPAISSPLNPDASKSRPPKPVQREQREKRETFKKREATASTRGGTPDVKKQKTAPVSSESPMRYNIPEPKDTDYYPPRDLVFASHEPQPLVLPDGQTELKRAVDIAWNKKGYRYGPCIADPHFRHKQFYRQTENKPYGPHMGFEDSDKWFHFDDTATIVTNEKGWRMGRGNVVAREGRMYYEVKIIKGVPAEGPVLPASQEKAHQPHIRMGWSRREAPLDAAVGYDGYSYGITDIRFESVHRSRPSKIYNPIPKGKKGVKNRSMIGNMAVEYVPDDHVREGDIIGLEISLPSLSLHQKVVSGIYNPAVDIGDGFNDASQSDASTYDIIRDRIPVPYKGSIIFEQLEYQSTKSMDNYSDRGPVPKIFPNPNHDDPALRSLPHSSIKIYKNGKFVGTAFENLMAFLPPASTPLASTGARPGFDDGMLGYFPCVAAFCGGIAQVNFGPDFWYPPPDLVSQDTEMTGNDSALRPAPNALRPLGDRYKEQIAEDVLWDVIDEVDFWMQDGGKDNVRTRGTEALKARGISEGEEESQFVGKF